MPIPIPKDNTPISPVLLYPVLKADELLLADPKRRRFLHKLQIHTGLETALYQALYETAITNFIEMVQALPYQEGGKAGSLMDYSLERAVVALRCYHQTSGAEFSPIFAYALFTAALFQDLGKVISLQSVLISDKEGKFIAEWLPFQGSLGAVKAEYYKLRIIGDQWIGLGQAATPLLARQCMPLSGFEWLASDYKIFSMWMSVLTGEKEKEDEFSLSYWLRISYKWLLELQTKDRLSALQINGTRPVQTALAEDFLAWLAQGLANGTIPVNTPDAYVHILAKRRMLLESGIFQQFCKMYGRNISWTMICKQLAALDAAKSNNGDYEFEKFSSKIAEGMSGENAARNPRLGGFFNVGTTSGMGMTAATREGLVLHRPDWVYNKGTAMPGAANLTALLPPPVIDNKSSLFSVPTKTEEWVAPSAQSKPSFDR